MKDTHPEKLIIQDSEELPLRAKKYVGEEVSLLQRFKDDSVHVEHENGERHYFHSWQVRKAQS